MRAGLAAPLLATLALTAAAGFSACHPRAGPVAQAEAPHAPCLPPRPPAAAAPATPGMAHIPGGRFVMGGAPLLPEEGPPRPTRVAGFWIDRTDVTNADFARFVAATHYVTVAERPLDAKAWPGLSPDQRRPSGIVFAGEGGTREDAASRWRVVPGADWRHPKGPGSSIAGRDDLPVVQVAWEDALAYARWLGHDLPTEAEWEFAARGPRPPGAAPTRYVWGDQPFDPKHPQANVWQGVFPVIDTGEDGYRLAPSPVGCFPANGWGLYDMAGDVWQWTADWYRPNLDPAGGEAPAGPSADAATDPRDPHAAPRHVIKGGSYLCSPDYCFRYRPAAREAGPADSGEDHVGFRTVWRG
ncbi:formylglycine-generating enzyme family protein [Caulobacter sp. KR2-114]|uniref:formylglycine-generating enzyme family protein n=1 Tax=Caulobacter sp. KR2-114 TaxID=3400912 RepID=UPI003C0487A5